VAFAQRGHFQLIDITGGAPELNPNLVPMIERLSPLAPRIMLRTNLTLLTDCKEDFLMDACKKHRVVIVASFPSLNTTQAEAQRRKGVFEKSIATLKKLNAIGYGHDGSGLELDLVSNPTGAFLPASQAQEEKRFRRDLERKWGITFNHVYTFANVPLGRFRQWLQHSGNLEKYLQNLASRFNPCAIEGLMCRTLISVSWDGYLYDCDFNLAKGLYMGGRKTHISEMAGPPKPGTPIAVSDHCYACTAGSGFT
jgi:radical SAM/Cys-rich protein